MIDVPPPPVTAYWQKSSATDGASCVEIARVHECIWVRDSKNPRGPALGFTREEWAVFLVGMQRGDFDRPGVSA